MIIIHVMVWYTYMTIHTVYTVYFRCGLVLFDGFLITFISQPLGQSYYYACAIYKFWKINHTLDNWNVTYQGKAPQNYVHVICDWMYISRYWFIHSNLPGIRKPSEALHVVARYVNPLRVVPSLIWRNKVNVIPVDILAPLVAHPQICGWSQLCNGTEWNCS